MSRLTSIVVGPELYWGLLYLVFRVLAARNVPPTATGNEVLTWAVWLSASVGVAASFALLAVPGANPWVMFVRLAVFGFVGVNACALLACDWIKYPEPGRNSGLMGLWIMAVILAGLVWIVGAAVSIYVLRVKAIAAAQPPSLP